MYESKIKEFIIELGKTLDKDEYEEISENVIFKEKTDNLKNNKKNTIDLQKDDISQEQIHAHDFIEVQKDDISQQEVHAHDFTQVEQDDITQQQVHAHDSWNNDGPIKYY